MTTYRKSPLQPPQHALNTVDFRHMSYSIADVAQLFPAPPPVPSLSDVADALDTVADAIRSWFDFCIAEGSHASIFVPNGANRARYASAQLAVLDSIETAIALTTAARRWSVRADLIRMRAAVGDVRDMNALFEDRATRRQLALSMSSVSTDPLRLQSRWLFILTGLHHVPEP